MWMLVAVLLLAQIAAGAEIQDVLKSAEIDRRFARAGESLVAHGPTLPPDPWAGSESLMAHFPEAA